MKHVLQNSKITLFTMLFLIVIGTSAWQLKGGKQHIRENHPQTSSDTTTPGANHTNTIDIRINTDSIMKAVQASLAAIDYNKIQQEVNASLASINFDEINKSVEASLKSINWDKMKIDVSKSLDEAKASIAQINTKELQAEMDKLKVELNSKAFKESINNVNIQKQIQLSLANAQKQLAKAQMELDNYKAFTKALQQDGLIKADQPYNIELKNNELYINDVKQSKETTEKYRRFYRGKTNFSMNEDNNDRNDNEDKSTDM